MHPAKPYGNTTSGNEYSWKDATIYKYDQVGQVGENPLKLALYPSYLNQRWLPIRCWPSAYSALKEL